VLLLLLLTLVAVFAAALIWAALTPSRPRSPHAEDRGRDRNLRRP
jgi:hypothetical protein